MDSVFISDRKADTRLGKIWNDENVRAKLLSAAPFFFATYYGDQQICAVDSVSIKIVLQFEEEQPPTRVSDFEQAVIDAHPLDIEINWERSMRHSSEGLVEIKSCIADKTVHLVVAPYILGYSKGPNTSKVILTHACGLVVNKCKKTVELFDPNGAIDHAQTYKDWDYSFFKDSKSLGKVLRGYKFLKHVDTCPAVGIRHAISEDVNEGMCAIWSIFLLHLRIVNHNMPTREFAALVSSLIESNSAEYFSDFIKRYTSHLYTIVKNL